MPHRTHRHALLLLLLAVLLASGPARLAAAPDDPPGTLRGVVQAGDTGDPLPGANVAVRRAADSTLVDGTTTDNTGHFAIEDLPLGAYTVVASFVGYTPQTRSITLTEDAPEQTLEPLHLAPATAQMDGVDVTAERAFMTTEGSKTIYDFDQTQVALASKSADDVLRDLPSVQIDFDGAISLRGSENVRVHVNGKPVPMQGEALVQYLKGLSADDIDRVEIDTNPSARHDPEGTAGRINIVLDRAEDPGWSGSVSASAGQHQRFDGSGNLGYQRGPWQLHAAYSANHGLREMEQELLRRSRAPDPTRLLDQLATNEMTRQGHHLSTQIDHQLTPKTTLSLTSTGSVFALDDTRDVSYAQAPASGDTDAPLHRAVQTDNRRWYLDERLSATQEFDTEHHTLSADLRYRTRDGRQTFEEETSLPTSPRERGTQEQRSQGASLEIDYTRPAGPGRIETGYKGSLRHVSRDYDLTRYDDASDRFVTVPERSRAFTFREDVHAAYGTLQRALGPFDAEAGLRLEHARTNVDPDGGASVANRYVSLYPSASLTYALSKARRLSLSYSKRVNRPSAQQLSFAGRLDDPYVRFVGNPDLDPERVHKVELTAMQHVGPATITLTPYVQRTVDAIEWRTTTSDSLTIRTPDNYDASTSFGTELTASLQLDRRFQASLSGNAYRVETNGSNLENDLTHDALAMMARANATWTVRPGWRLQLSQFYRSPVETGLGQLDAFYRTEVAVEHAFWNDRATLGLRVRDPFNTSEMGFRQQTRRFTEQMTNRWNGRSLSLSFSYRFGDADDQKPRRRPPQNGGGTGIMGGN